MVTNCVRSAIFFILPILQKVVLRLSERGDVIETQTIKFVPPKTRSLSGSKGKTDIANHLHDHVDHVSVRQQSQQLGGETAVPYSVVGCCEVDEHSSGLLFS